MPLQLSPPPMERTQLKTRSIIPVQRSSPTQPFTSTNSPLPPTRLSTGRLASRSQTPRAGRRHLPIRLNQKRTSPSRGAQVHLSTPPMRSLLRLVVEIQVEPPTRVSLLRRLLLSRPVCRVRLCFLHRLVSVRSLQRRLKPRRPLRHLPPPGLRGMFKEMELLV